MRQCKILATDMDGTFIPLEGNQQNHHDLATLCSEIESQELVLVYVTGRHYELVLDAIDRHSLPTPNWLICDVGASIYQQSDRMGHQNLAAYHNHLSELVGSFDRQTLVRSLQQVGELVLQEAEKQGEFKLSYYCDSSKLDETHQRVVQVIAKIQAPFRVIASVDPFTHQGLIDCLPEGVSKDYALRWWVDHIHCDHDEVVFAGDSGNDLAALTTGYRSIVVANADAAVVDQARRAHREAGWTDRLHLATLPATSGVLEGIRHFQNLD